MARPAFIVTFTVEGRPLHVRRDAILMVGSGLEQPVDEKGFPNGEPQEAVMVTIEGVGHVKVEHTVNEALRIWDGLGPSKVTTGDLIR